MYHLKFNSIIINIMSFDWDIWRPLKKKKKLNDNNFTFCIGLGCRIMLLLELLDEIIYHSYP